MVAKWDLENGVTVIRRCWLQVTEIEGSTSDYDYSAELPKILFSTISILLTRLLSSRMWSRRRRPNLGRTKCRRGRSAEHHLAFEAVTNADNNMRLDLKDEIPTGNGV